MSLFSQQLVQLSLANEHLFGKVINDLLTPTDELNLTEVLFTFDVVGNSLPQ